MSFGRAYPGRPLSVSARGGSGQAIAGQSARPRGPFVRNRGLDPRRTDRSLLAVRP